MQVRKQLNKKADYERGEILVCRKYFRHNKITYNVNYEYKITKIVQGGIVLDNDSILPPAPPPAELHPWILQDMPQHAGVEH